MRHKQNVLHRSKYKFHQLLNIKRSHYVSLHNHVQQTLCIWGYKTTLHDSFAHFLNQFLIQGLPHIWPLVSHHHWACKCCSCIEVPIKHCLLAQILPVHCRIIIHKLCITGNAVLPLYQVLFLWAWSHPSGGLEPSELWQRRQYVYHWCRCRVVGHGGLTLSFSPNVCSSTSPHEPACAAQLAGATGAVAVAAAAVATQSYFNCCSESLNNRQVIRTLVAVDSPFVATSHRSSSTFSQVDDCNAVVESVRSPLLFSHASRRWRVPSSWLILLLFKILTKIHTVAFSSEDICDLILSCSQLLPLYLAMNHLDCSSLGLCRSTGLLHWLLITVI